MHRLQHKLVLVHASVLNGDLMGALHHLVTINLIQVQSPVLSLSLNQNQSRNQMRVQVVLMRGQFQIEMKMGETLNKVITVHFRKTESKMDLTILRGTKKETSSTKTKTSRFKTLLDGMIILMQVAQG